MTDNGRRFIVTCHGWSASNWVAHALNQHRQISCGHSAGAFLASDPHLFDGDGLKHHIPKLRSGYLQRQSRAMDAVYEDLARQAPAEYLGTVHTYRLRDLPAQAERFPQPGRSYRTVNLVRHPLDLVVSGYGQFRDLFRIDLNEFSWTLRKIVNQGLDQVEAICRRHGIVPGDYDALCFFGACVVLGSLRQDLDALDLIQADRDTPWDLRGTVRMEDVTTDSAAFADLVERLTGAPDLAGPEYLARVFAQGPVNRHNRGAAVGTLARWRDLAPWQHEAFLSFMECFNLYSPYERLGYSFDFGERRDSTL